MRSLGKVRASGMGSSPGRVERSEAARFLANLHISALKVSRLNLRASIPGGGWQYRSFP